MKFYFCIRSIGERTEHLCFDAIIKEMPDAIINIIRNVTPSYQAYKSMFDWAMRLRSLDPNGWLVAIDADVVMLPGWSKNLIESSLKVAPNKTFKFTFQVYDPIFETSRSRGNHIYQLSHIDKAYEALMKNIKIIEEKKIKNINKDFLLKPESSIRIHLEDKLKVVQFPEIIGIHGAEQYFREIIRTFKIRRHREPDLDKTFEFLLAEKRSDLIKKLEYDKLAANLGWYAGSNLEEIISIDKGNKQEINNLIQKYSIVERNELIENYDRFCQIYKIKQ